MNNFITRIQKFCLELSYEFFNQIEKKKKKKSGDTKR